MLPPIPPLPAARSLPTVPLPLPAARSLPSIPLPLPTLPAARSLPTIPLLPGQATVIFYNRGAEHVTGKIVSESATSITIETPKGVRIRALRKDIVS